MAKCEFFDDKKEQCSDKAIFCYPNHKPIFCGDHMKEDMKYIGDEPWIRHRSRVTMTLPDIKVYHAGYNSVDIHLDAKLLMAHDNLFHFRIQDFFRDQWMRAKQYRARGKCILEIDFNIPEAMIRDLTEEQFRLEMAKMGKGLIQTIEKAIYDLNHYDIANFLPKDQSEDFLNDNSAGWEKYGELDWSVEIMNEKDEYEMLNKK